MAIQNTDYSKHIHIVNTFKALITIMTYQVILVVAGVAINNRLKFQNSKANDFSNAPAVIVVFSLGDFRELHFTGK